MSPVSPCVLLSLLHAQSTTPLPPFTGSHRSSYCYKLVLFSKSYIIEPYRRDFTFAFYKQTDVVLFTFKITLKFPHVVPSVYARQCSTLWMQWICRRWLIHSSLDQHLPDSQCGVVTDRAAVTFMYQLSSAYVCLAMPKPHCHLV